MYETIDNIDHDQSYQGIKKVFKKVWCNALYLINK